MSLTDSSAQLQIKTTSVPRGSNKRGGLRGVSHKGKTGRTAKKEIEKPQEAEHKRAPTEEDAVPAADANGELDVCFICAEPVKYYSVSECNHRTCHVCALRLRALYKKPDCTFCKESQPSVVFTISPDAVFTSFVLDSLQYKDSKLSIYFETQEMMEETLLLLRFNCPDPDCVYIGNGWADLRLHTRATHGKLMCDLCVRMKKVFAHEHALYAPNALPVHLPSMHLRSHGRAIPKDQVEGGVHPLCEFCRECFFGDDEHYAHMRERHEECFICKRNDVRFMYFENYESLENHFNRAHHPCTHSHCLAQKFVVFNTPLDLQAHMVEEHGSGMSSRDKKEARRVQAGFEFEDSGAGGRHGRRDRGHREREHEPLPNTVPSIPHARQGPGRRREDFGANLTVENASPTPNVTSTEPVRSLSPQQDLDPAAAERHELFLGRLQSLATNPTTAVPAVKAAIRGYKSSESSARDLISTVWNVLDQNVEHTASIINAFVDLLDQEDKKQDLLSSWRGFALEQRREFPDLMPTAVASGSAPYAAITSGRVLSAKHATATRSSQRSSRQVWDRVAQAASSSFPMNVSRPTKPKESFPVLLSGTPQATATRSGQRNTPWSSSSSGFRTTGGSGAGAMPTPAQAASSHVTVVPDPRPSRPSSGRNTPQPPPPKLSNALFPELPSSNSVRKKPPLSGNTSMKNIMGTTSPAVSAWTGGSRDANVAAPTTEAVENAESGTGKGKKAKGKQKQTLFTLGTFPT